MLFVHAVYIPVEVLSDVTPLSVGQSHFSVLCDKTVLVVWLYLGTKTQNIIV